MFILRRPSVVAALFCALLSIAGAPVAASPFKAAAITFDPAWGDVDGNIRRIVEAANKAADQGARLLVFPETATTGYIFDSFAMARPFLDPIPGKATDALAKVTAARNIYISIGLAEFDPASGLAYNSAALVGPKGYIGKYRKHGLNPQDQLLFAQGNLGFPVFDTELGRIMPLICYDDTYWQYGRMSLLHDADIIAWSSVSDRVMPGTPAKLAKADHSTVANVQYLSAHNGVFVVAATRNGIETNPLTKQQLYYNGGSSIWNPKGEKIAQAPVSPPETIPSGTTSILIADIDPEAGKPVRDALLALRRPSLYGLLALHRAPTDARATTQPRKIDLAAQAARPERPLAYLPPPRGGLLVLPALFRRGPAFDPQQLEGEEHGGPSERDLKELARRGKGYVVGSYAEKAGNLFYHTVALASPAGEIVARYRATHPKAGSPWAAAGDDFVVAETPIGRIGLLLLDETAIPETFGHLAAQRADVIAAPGRVLPEPTVQIDPKLYNVPPPPGTPYYPFAAAMLSQTWLAAAGWTKEGRPSAWVFGPEPVIATPPSHNPDKADRISRRVEAPWSGTWINQQQLIGGQSPYATIPLVLDMEGACFKSWRKAEGWTRPCW
jgi:predicted amidohydrolase